MTATWADVLAALKQTSQGLDGAESYDYVPDSPVLPAVMWYVESWPLNVTEDKTVIGWCVTGAIDEAGAQARLGEWLTAGTTNSLIDLIDADSRLGNVVSSVLPLEVRNARPAQVQEGRARVWQAELVCLVFP
jgi:hypothetical protein